MSDLNTGLKYKKGCSDTDRVKWRVCQYSRYQIFCLIIIKSAEGFLAIVEREGLSSRDGHVQNCI